MSRAISAILVLLAVMARPSVSIAGTTDQDVRAAYLINILRLSHRKSPPPVSSPDLTLCLYRPGAIEQPLQALENSVVQGRKLRIRNIKKPEIAGCDVVFFGETSGAEPALARAQSLGILTIGNDAEFIAISGMVALIVENRRMVVEIGQAAVRQGSWVFSSHLLEIARVTQEGVR